MPVTRCGCGASVEAGAPAVEWSSKPFEGSERRKDPPGRPGLDGLAREVKAGASRCRSPGPPPFWAPPPHAASAKRRKSAYGESLRRNEGGRTVRAGARSLLRHRSSASGLALLGLVSLAPRSACGRGHPDSRSRARPAGGSAGSVAGARLQRRLARGRAPARHSPPRRSRASRRAQRSAPRTLGSDDTAIRTRRPSTGRRRASPTASSASPSPGRASRPGLALAVAGLVLLSGALVAGVAREVAR